MAMQLTTLGWVDDCSDASSHNNASNTLLETCFQNFDRPLPRGIQKIFSGIVHTSKERRCHVNDGTYTLVK